MAVPSVVREHVEQVLSQLAGSPVAENADGNYPFRVGSAQCFVSLVDDEPPLVSVFGGLLSGVTITDELCAAVNDINASIKFGRVFAVRDRVVVATELPAADVDRSEIEHLVGAIGRVADEYDTDLQARFGGTLSFREQASA